jgi:hypothetical protein
MTNFVVEVRFVIVTPLHPHFFEERYDLAKHHEKVSYIVTELAENLYKENLAKPNKLTFQQAL